MRAILSAAPLPTKESLDPTQIDHIELAPQLSGHLAREGAMAKKEIIQIRSGFTWRCPVDKKRTHTHTQTHTHTHVWAVCWSLSFSVVNKR